MTTYSQIYIQVVFAVKYRDALIHESWEEELYKYITGIVQNKEQKLLAFIKEKRFTPFNFQWQEGFGAFSYSHSSLDNVIRYIMGQKEHHKKQTFKDEYLDFLKRFSIEYKEEYVFDWLD